jgi:small subunit ribosomal protein S16
MPTRIRLQRKGKKGQPFYHIVIADGRAPRDGKFIERIGIYNPLAKPAEIELDFDKALDWLQKGASPTETVRAIFSYKGILYKHHLLTGVKKGALTPEAADEKFQEWLKVKQEKIAHARNEEQLSVKEAKKQQLAYEAGINEAIANSVAKKQAKEREAQVASIQAEEARVAESVAQIAADRAAGAVAETPAEPVSETPAEAVAETPSEPVAETPAQAEEEAKPEVPPAE